MSPNVLTKAKSYANYWNKKFGLDLSLTIGLCCVKDDEDLEDAFAIIRYDIAHRTAEILVNSEKTEDDLLVRYKYGMEELMVHELLHVVFGRIHSIGNIAMKDDTKALTNFEDEMNIVIDNMATVLVEQELKLREATSKLSRKKK